VRILKRNDLISVLVEDMDEEILKELPEWFKVLREKCNSR
jgi:DNA replicative helicase MCM subunit Mcm2 (Cdc46/Mcm family)